VALTVGSVEVAADGSASGSGWALHAFTWRAAAREARWAEIGFTPTEEQRFDAFQALAAEATAEATEMVPYILANI
jgi:hypothetical protein